MRAYFLRLTKASPMVKLRRLGVLRCCPMVFFSVFFSPFLMRI
ncbi:uncharacterized protein G2W53_001482 [Senna tora]|uniref:Uncharacterized protein n=1 Tax=Senna tora TaxID=362788 RepID=A0A835CML7_9FABA|nr:uncharacterized protein G2W53_001482 [Senna tora]